MSLGLEGIIVESAPAQIARRIREAILAGKIEANERLPTEDELAKQFGVSRATLREALKRLAAENLIESRRGAAGGNYVKTPSRDDIRNDIASAITVGVSFNLFAFQDFAHTRLKITQACCQLAASARTSDDLEQLRQELILQRQPELTDVDFCASDVRFHCLIANATGNRLLAASFAGILQGLEPIMNFLLFKFKDRAVITAQHERIIAALEAGDAAAADAVLIEQTEYLANLQSAAELARKNKNK